MQWGLSGCRHSSSTQAEGFCVLCDRRLLREIKTIFIEMGE
jgi:hypothetical protein